MNSKTVEMMDGKTYKRPYHTTRLYRDSLGHNEYIPIPNFVLVKDTVRTGLCTYRYERIRDAGTGKREINKNRKDNVKNLAVLTQ